MQILIFLHYHCNHIHFLKCILALTVKSMLLASLLPLKSPLGVYLESFTNGLKVWATLETARFNFPGVLLKEKARLTRFPNLKWRKRVWWSLQSHKLPGLFPCINWRTCKVSTDCESKYNFHTATEDFVLMKMCITT